jgi:hypothetical protein
MRKKNRATMNSPLRFTHYSVSQVLAYTGSMQRRNVFHIEGEHISGKNGKGCKVI